MHTASRANSQALDVLQQSVLAQGEQIRAILEKLEGIPDRRDVADVAEQINKLGELLCGVEAKLARGEQILGALDEYEFGANSRDGVVLKRNRDRRRANKVREIMEAKIPVGSIVLIV